MNTTENYRARKKRGIQKHVWIPFDADRILKETAIATGLTQREIILKGVDLVAAQSQQVTA